MSNRELQGSVMLAVPARFRSLTDPEMRTLKKDHLYTQIGVGVVFATHQSTNGLLHRLVLVRVFSGAAFLAISALRADLNGGLGRFINEYFPPRIRDVSHG